MTAKGYIQRTGAGAVQRVDGGLFLYVWGEGGLTSAVKASHDELHLIRPSAAVLHDGPTSLLNTLARNVSDVRSAHPSLRIWVGVGMDGTVGLWRQGKRTAEQVIAPLRAVAKLCEQLGVEGIIWNGESQWKDQPNDAVTGAQIEALGDECGRELTIAAPNRVHWLSSFDQPNLHGALRYFMRGFTKHVSAYAGQPYVAVAGGAPLGALDRRIKAAERGQELAERAGMLPDDITILDVAFDVDRIHTFQCYATPLSDLARVAAEANACAIWSAPMLREGGRTDPAGLVAIQFAQRVRDSGLTIVEYQHAKGLKPDGVVGPMTLRAAGLTPP